MRSGPSVAQVVLDYYQRLQRDLLFQNVVGFNMRLFPELFQHHLANEDEVGYNAVPTGHLNVQKQLALSVTRMQFHIRDHVR